MVSGHRCSSIVCFLCGIVALLLLVEFKPRWSEKDARVIGEVIAGVIGIIVEDTTERKLSAEVIGENLSATSSWDWRCQNVCYPRFGFWESDCYCDVHSSWYMWVCRKYRGKPIKTQFCGMHNCGGCHAVDEDPEPTAPPAPTALPSPSPAPAAVDTCAGAWKPCNDERCCQSPGQKCYQKNEGWSQCRDSCTPGVHGEEPMQWQQPWTCTPLGGSGPAPAPTTRAPSMGLDPDRYYTIEFASAEGKFLSVAGNSKVNGAKIHLWDNPQELSTQWRLRKNTKGLYTIENANAVGEYLNVDANGRFNGARINLWDNPQYPSTQWRIVKTTTGTYTIENVNAAGKYLSVRHNSHHKGARIHLWSKKAQWRIAEAPGYHALDERLMRPSTAEKKTFYMYRVQGDADYPPENQNMANLAGALWYLHNEIVNNRYERRFHKTRIQRFKMTTQATQPLIDDGMNFGVRFAFDAGQCTGPWRCADVFQRYGHVVGCNNVGQFPTAQWKGKVFYPNAVWYSLPGKCSTKRYNKHTVQCDLDEPGGHCDNVTGTGNCTYSYTYAGDISIDELENITDFKEFAKAGGWEYNNKTDRGVHMTFWDNKYNTSVCEERLSRANALFAEKFENEAFQQDLPDPTCDFSSGRFYAHVPQRNP